MTNIKNNLDFLNRLRYSNHAKEFKSIILTAGKELILTFCELLANVLRQVVPITNTERNFLRKHFISIRKLGRVTGLSLKERKGLIIRHAEFYREVIRLLLPRILGILNLKKEENQEGKEGGEEEE